MLLLLLLFLAAMATEAVYSISLRACDIHWHRRRRLRSRVPRLRGRRVAQSRVCGV